MNKFNVLIVDDEPIQRRIMREFCVQSRFFSVIDEAKDGIEAIEKLSSAQFDLVLLDINMPLLSGLSLARTLKHNTKVIFVTAYAEHAVEAFELSVIDYLLKPVAFEHFMQAIQKLLPEEKVIPQPTDTTSFVTLKQGKKTLKVNTADILYCEAKGNNTFIYLNDETHLDVYMPLSKLQEDLPQNTFVRVHRSFIINKEKVKAVENNLLHIGNAKVPVGANFRDEVKGLL